MISSSSPGLLLQPLAVLLEAREDGQADEARAQAARQALARLEQVLLRQGAPVGPVSLDEAGRSRLLEQIGAARRRRRERAVLSPWPLIDEVLGLVEARAWGSLPALYRDLLSWHGDWQGELAMFARLYPDETAAAAGAEAALAGYREAVGALAEEAWTEGARRLGEVSRALEEVSAEWERVRRERGFSRFPVVDQLGWEIRGGGAVTAPVAELLDGLEGQARAWLRDRFPDPRVSDEWLDLFGPRLQALRGRLATPDAALPGQLHEYLEEHARWLERAGQARDYSPLPWWHDLRRAAVRWYRGVTPRAGLAPLLAAARGWLPTDLSGWSGPDRAQRRELLDETLGWLEDLEDVLRRRDRAEVAEWVAWGDDTYDRWLWLAKS